MRRQTDFRMAVMACCALTVKLADAAGETVCNIPVSGTLLAGDSTAPYSQIRYAKLVNTDSLIQENWIIPVT